MWLLSFSRSLHQSEYRNNLFPVRDSERIAALINWRQLKFESRKLSASPGPTIWNATQSVTVCSVPHYVHVLDAFFWVQLQAPVTFDFAAVLVFNKSLLQKCYPQIAMIVTCRHKFFIAPGCQGGCLHAEDGGAQLLQDRLACRGLWRSA